MDMLLEKWFCFFLIVLKFRATTAESTSGKMRRFGTVGEYSCANSSTVFNETGFVNNIQCAVKCFGIPTCFAAVYEPTLQRCVGCKVEFDLIGSGAWNQFLRPFHVIEASKNWFESKDDCEQLGARLVVIKTKHEHDVVANVLAMSGASKVWLGASDMYVEGNFMWLYGALVSDGYERWRDGNPDDLPPNGQDCLSMERQIDGTYQLNDFNCAMDQMWALCVFY